MLTTVVSGGVEGDREREREKRERRGRENRREEKVSQSVGRHGPRSSRREQAKHEKPGSAVNQSALQSALNRRVACCGIRTEGPFGLLGLEVCENESPLRMVLSDICSHASFRLSYSHVYLGRPTLFFRLVSTRSTFSGKELLVYQDCWGGGGLSADVLGAFVFGSDSNC